MEEEKEKKRKNKRDVAKVTTGLNKRVKLVGWVA